MNDKKKSASSEFEGMSGDKQKALTAALAQIEKQFGKGSIMRLGDAEINQEAMDSQNQDDLVPPLDAAEK